MKHLKQKAACAVFLASTLTFIAPPSSVTPVYAETINNSTLVIDNATAGSYKLYQLFTGDFADMETDHKVIGQVDANPVYKDALVKSIQAFKPDFTLAGSDTAQSNQLAEAIEELSTNAQAFANTLAQNLENSAPSQTQTSANDTVSFSITNTGYYLVLSDSSNKTITSAIMVPVTKSGVTNCTLKASTPAVSKTVTSIHGLSDAKYGQAGIADNTVQAPTYKITGTINQNIMAYDKYSYVISDTLPAGFETTKEEIAQNWNVKITASFNDTDTPKDISANAALNLDGQKITWSFDDLKSVLIQNGLTQENASSVKITVTYTPVYDETEIQNLYGQASSLNSPQINMANITYSNNPYKGSETSTASTPDDLTSVYSYNLQLKKIGKNNEAINGAEFTLTDENGTTVGKEIQADEDGQFTWTGLEAGMKYILTETQAPAGYKRIDPIEFTITALPNASATAVQSIEVTESADPSNAAFWNGDSDKQDGAAFTSATAIVNIANVPGAYLPSTGQQGIVIGSIAGIGILSISAIALLKKKKEHPFS